jgi:hypothetical protein
MTNPPEPEARGDLVPPNRRPPTAVGAGLLPPQEGPRSPVGPANRSARSWLLRMVDRTFWLLDRVGEDIARALGLRRSP